MCDISFAYNVVSDNIKKIISITPLSEQPSNDSYDIIMLMEDNKIKSTRESKEYMLDLCKTHSFTVPDKKIKLNCQSYEIMDYETNADAPNYKLLDNPHGDLKHTSKPSTYVDMNKYNVNNISNKPLKSLQIHDIVDIISLGACDNSTPCKHYVTVRTKKNKIATIIYSSLMLYELYTKLNKNIPIHIRENYIKNQNEDDFIY
jgi:hypothetical protein